ncbi:MAG: hypothetical protein NC320_06475 [Clostridium sp.]|nr:hypothetical protein [Clostridium sp.]
MKVNSIYNSNINNINVKVKTSSDKNWTLTDSLKSEIEEMAKEDAHNNVYMDSKFMNLRKNEVAKVSPNRGAIIGKIGQSSPFGDMDNMKKIEEADRKWLCMLFGKPYKAEYQSHDTGSAIHVYDENGDEILTYTGGVGWHKKESKAENEVHQTLKSVYYEAYHSERQNIKSQLKTNSDLNITV